MDAVREELARLGVVHEELPCDPALADTAEFCAHYEIPPDHTVNTIVVVDKREPRSYVVCAVLADTRLDVNKTLRKTLGSRKLSFASAEETRELTGMEIGGVTPFGIPSGLPLYVDPGFFARDYVILGGGSRDWKIRCAPDELRKHPDLHVVEGLAKAR